ncbi:hypothetical protein LX15_006104 [Streptoalloteichus tenebrarius]|uniref:DUF1440 domain-containing protein n=1 Tax=Streptoalloteichus tenebrarius (strain ATCC 17920 / DSM 40477 / JCM 4838 / CBS 697.72 / NBRC 16177 / NCIMB 11028 / NRRL B-12390 / A12253. 1 / ISP 5477) TaxID=1933 RepID=A0ABT1I3K0_STRSD|nr:hypothetical protein [Streptoalloteichus tenebrarius]
MRPEGKAPLVQGAARGVVGAMAMSGLRTLSAAVGALSETPPEAIVRERGRGLLRAVPKRGERGVIELLHWAYGAVGGAAYALVPSRLRDHAWVGPLYGALLWGMFEAGMAPLLGLRRTHQPRPAERVALLVDHLLYGWVVGAASPLRRDS